MKKIYIPNSQYFSAIPTGTDPFMEIFNLQSKIHEVVNIPDARINKANRYLRKMYNRLEKYARKTNAKGFTVISMVLLKRSIAFRLAAINFKWPKWYSITKGSEFKKINEAVKGLTERLETEIEYKRVWIPKGSDPYGRPLGCPTVPWRIYLWMFYFLTDIWISNNHGRAPWQHGGFSRKGPNTFFDQLIGKSFYKRKYIYEFDLKGYFNNITHESILKSLEATKIPEFIASHVKKAIKSQPTEYKLPPFKEDSAIEKYSKMMIRPKGISVLPVKEYYNMSTFHVQALIRERYPPMDLINSAFEDKARNNAESPHPMITWEVSESRKLSYEKAFERGKNIDRSEMIRLAWEDKARNRAIEAAEIEYEENQITLRETYKALMEDEEVKLNHPISDLIFKEIKPPTKDDQAIGRDNWAGLGLEGRGTPQGVSYSPLLTSVTSSVIAGIKNENLMMYMDDGIIAADTEEELNLAITEFKESIKTMGVELALNKSGMVKQSGIWLKDLKIIGFRIDRFLDWVFSSTRSGTEIPMPLPNYEQLRSYYTHSGVTSFTDDDKMELIEALRKLDLIPEGSRARFIEWIERTFGRSISILRSELEQKEFNPYTYGTHELMVKEGKSGKALAHIWNPSEEDVREKITEGVKLAIKAIQDNPKSFVMDKLGPYKIEQIAKIGPKGLQDLSTKMSVEYLKWEARKKERPKLTVKGNTGTIYTIAGIRRPRKS